MLAVMLVVRNRVHAGWMGGDWLQVLSAHQLYSANACMDLTGYPDLRKMRDILTAVDEVYDGFAQDFTEGALYYAELDNVDSEWFAETILKQQVDHPRVAKVGPIDFFK